MNEQKFIPFKIGSDIDIEVRDLDPGVSLVTHVCPLPERRREELFLEIMRANYLGQATGEARLAISRDELFLTLCLGLPYEMTYRSFREAFEDFINFLLYWRREVEKFYQQETLL